MKKITTIKRANLIGNVYENKVMGNIGYSYKIYLGKQIRSQLLSQSYVYFADANECIEQMDADISNLLEIKKDLFDLSKLERM